MTLGLPLGYNTNGKFRSCFQFSSFTSSLSAILDGCVSIWNKSFEPWLACIALLRISTQTESHIARTPSHCFKVRNAADFNMEKADTRIITLQYSDLAEEDKDLSNQIEGVKLFLFSSYRCGTCA